MAAAESEICRPCTYKLQYTIQRRGSIIAITMFQALFVCLLLNGTSALFRLLVPRIARLTSSTYGNNVDVDKLDEHK